MIDTILFDLDGVLVETKDLHYKTLNEAIEKIAGKKYIITKAEHLSVYDGLKTTQKLELLTSNKNLSTTLYNKIWTEKQRLTADLITNMEPDESLVNMFKKLSNEGYKLGCCSNSIKKTVNKILSRLGIIEYMDIVLSNDDVRNGKPHPEIYWKAMSLLNTLPDNTMIIEDSPVGLLSATRSSAHVMRVKNSGEVFYENIKKNIKKEKHMIKPKWVDKKLNVLIPMAGAGSRFEKAGYTFPKPLIDVNGKPMIQVVTENLNIDANYIYIVQKSHREKYNLDTLLNLISPNCKIVEVDGVTEGAACTTLLAKEFIDNDNPLITANSDQFLEWDSNEFMYKMNESNCDGGILTFKATHPKWSFVKVNENGYVTEVAEKKPISDIATVGVYYWVKGSDYVKYAEDMIKKNIRVNNEFYVAPVFNEAISDHKNIKIFDIKKMWGLGTPEDLNTFLKNYE